MTLPKFVRDHAFFIVFYGGIFTAFLWPLILFQKTFIFGDYWQQHYPWAHEYARHVLEGTLPYWVRGMAAGFPLVAEGQIGAYYLFNLLFYRVLPFEQAYNYSILSHVLAGGVGFYVYLRRLGLSTGAASVGAVLFSFGSGYGGCFTNTATLRAMAWLPWCLWALDRFDEETGKSVYGSITLVGILLSQMWNAGSPQIALYATGYVVLYWALFFRLRQWAAVAAMLAVAAVLTAPQWMATYELLGESVRAGESAAFALWGSVLPPAVSSLVFPKWGDVLGISFYAGEAAILLLAVSLFSRKTSRERIHYALGVLFLLAAFGRYNPVYDWAVKEFSITFFRNPGKFLFFASTSLCVIAAFGYDHLARIARDAGAAGRFKRVLAVLTGLVLAAPLLGGRVFAAFSERFLSMARGYAAEAFSQKKDPLQSAEQYQARADALFQRMSSLFDYADPWNLAALGFFLVSMLAVLRSLGPDRRGAWKRIVLPAVLAADLLFFGHFIGSGFIGNAREMTKGLSSPLASQMRRHQEEAGGLFVEWAGDPSRELMPPNANLYYQLDSPSGYSPLLIGRYYELVRELGIVDSSLGRAPFSLDVWRRERGLWRAIGTGQIVSDRPLELADTVLHSKIRQSVPSPKGLVRTERYWYHVVGALPPVYAVYDWKVLPDAAERLRFLKSEAFDPGEAAVVEEAPPFSGGGAAGAVAGRIVEDGALRVVAEIHPEADALAVFGNASYPGWKVKVNGLEQKLVSVNHAFSGVFLKAGEHTLEFFYDRGRLVTAERVSVGGWFLLLYSNILIWKRRRKAAMKAR